MKSAYTKYIVVLFDFWYCLYKTDFFLLQHFALHNLKGAMLVISREA